jgi:trans-aconitate 2-methyltransferase
MARFYCLDIEISFAISTILMSRDIWDPKLYARYAAERTRPFHDLVARIHADDPRYVVDAGCGSGALTAELARRWPHAEVLGFDSSPAMIDEARRHAGERLSFAVRDVRDPLPDEHRIDVLVSNAVLQWVPEHRELLADPTDYLDLLAGQGLRVDAWETTYIHVLPPGEDAVLNWIEGTALRPVLNRLAETERAAFLAECGALLRDAYPSRSYGVPFPFRRVFVVAEKTG